MGSPLSEWSLRSARERDIPGMLALWSAAGSVPTVTDDHDSLAALLSFDPEAIVVAELDGALVGSLIAGWDGWRGTFYRLAVRSDHRRRGLATALVGEGEGRLRRRGAVRLNAIVAPGEGAAMRFWEAAGYIPKHGQLRYVRPDIR